MKKSKCVYALLFLLVFPGKFYSQKLEKIKFQKDPSSIYFFYQGVKSDTLSKNKENLFYLLVSDSLKKDLVIEIDNGQLMVTGNDSLFKLNYIPGFKYESFYQKKQELGNPPSKKSPFEFQTFVNGVSALVVNRIQIVLRHKMTGQMILENTFFIN